MADVQYCDFVAWNKSKDIIVRVERDVEFWDREYPKTTLFFLSGPSSRIAWMFLHATQGIILNCNGVKVPTFTYYFIV